MPSRTENSDRALANSRRWRLNSKGQLVDTEVVDVSAWEIVDEMNRINLNDGTPDTEDVRLPVRTPKSKLPASTVSHINETSPLDSSSTTSIDSSPNPQPEHPISHSRGSSADTTTSSTRDSVAGNPLLAHPPLKVAPVEAKERPHSFSGGLSTADLRRLQQVGDPDHDRQLQQQQWAQNQYREANVEQLSYPSLTNQVHRPLPQQAVQQPMFNYPPPTLQAHQRSDSEREGVQLDYGHQQQLRRNFNPAPIHGNHAPGMSAQTPPPPQFVQGRPNNANQAINYRQNVRGFPPGPSPTALVYPGGHHTPHLSLGNTQQLYEMMLPGPPHDNNNPAVTRVQQQHNIFRATHHHSASDPSAIRDIATLALLNNNMQNFAPNMFQPGMPLYPNQYYGAQDLAVQQAIAARLQSHYSTPPYNVAAAQNLPGETGVGSPTSSSGQTGPSANNRKLGLYKTELCRSWEEKGTCRYGTKCQFAHGEDELRTVSRHPKYKTEICKTFWVSGSCPYGKRCCFIHTELSSATTPGTSGTSENTPPPQADVRERSNSDPDASSSVSLLARISQRSQEQSGISTPVDLSASANTFQFTRPPTGSLRVDTTVLDASMKQNKSAYPSFASNGILLPAPEHIAAKSPAPVTAGPDLGRHNLARMEIVGYPPNKKVTTASSSNTNPRHSFNGSEVDVNFSPSPPASSHSYTLASAENNQGGQTRVNGHVRSGSAGNWASFSRSNLSTATYPNPASPAGEIMSNSPWSSTELAVGTSRLHEKAWA